MLKRFEAIVVVVFQLFIISIIVTCCSENECTPDCSSKECGDDGCGGLCVPGCDSDETCNEDTGQCDPNEIYCSDIGEIIQLGTYDLPDYAYDIEVVGEQAYIADAEGGLQIVNISDPTNPTFTSELFGGFGALGIDVQGSYAYIAYADDGLYVVDIGDPSAPERIGYGPSAGWRFHDVSIVDDTAYVAWDYHDGGGGMVIYDVSDPSRPVRKGYCETGQLAVGITIDDRFAYIANLTLGVYTIELLKPEIPLGSYDTPGQAYAIAIEGNYGYIADGQSGLQIIDISNRRYPSFVAELDLQDNVVNVMIVEQYAYMTGTEKFHIVDVHDPSNPIFVKSYDQFTGSIGGLDVRGNLAYLGGDSLHVVKVCDLP